MFSKIMILSTFLVSTSVSAVCTSLSPDLKGQNTINCQGPALQQQVLLKHKATYNADYYISMELNNCGDYPTYTWEELDVEGRVVNSQDATVMNMVKGKDYQLRVSIHEPNCKNYNLTFQLAKLY